MDDEQVTPEYEFNIDNMSLDATIVELHQEGNWLIGRTSKGIKFRQGIPAGKMLNKNEKGDWIFQDLREVA